MGPRLVVGEFILSACLGRQSKGGDGGLESRGVFCNPVCIGDRRRTITDYDIAAIHI